MAEPGAYILGVDPEELERLRFQHEAWAQQARALFRSAGFRAGHSLLDLGSGPGFTTLELAAVTGPSGRVLARDQSQSFLAYLRAECARRGIRGVETSLGPVETLELPLGSLDGAYARWLLCWLPDPGAVLARVAKALRPGGVVALQEYVDWGAMRLIPHGEAFAASVAACMESWRQGGGTMDLCGRVPELAAAAGLAVVHFAPIARIGAVGSVEWRWIGEFLRIYLPKLVERGQLPAARLEAHVAEWRSREREGTSFVLTPTMADVVLAKPASA